MKKTIVIVLIMLLGISFSKAQTMPTAEDKIYSFVAMENPPKFPGGMAAFYKFLGENMKYPEQAKKTNVQGTVFVSFIIEKDGSVSNVKTVRGLGAGTDQEAERVLGLSPKWAAGTKEGKPVRVKYNIPVKFTNSAKK
ncbi:energy transducer TonB [Pedobacter sp. SL55]|uniref:energy transducer TonB n=1 Tax=Pedobacter sp. SL55 TaxID=2995161 RepID=UPI0022706D2F|nr:energy transducer TonB [Pedobacter sp. SL55]WAC41558.1 energy transducer TonB [Pedobacter sp. SL55]